ESGRYHRPPPPLTGLSTGTIKCRGERARQPRVEGAPLVTPRGARLVRGGLMVVLVGVSTTVALSLRRPAARSATPSPSPSVAPAREGTRLEGFIHRTVKTDKDGNVTERVTVRAKSFEGKDQEEQRLKGVQVDLTYMAQGQPGKATITADQGTYVAVQQ